MKNLIAKVTNMQEYSEKAIVSLQAELQAARQALELQSLEKDSLATIKYADTSEAIAEVYSAMVKQKESIEYLEHLILERGREISNYKAILSDLTPLADRFTELEISRVVGVVNG